MNDPDIGQHARRDIDTMVQREAGFREPPVDIGVVLDALNLDRDFYDLQEPGLLRRLQHRIIIGARRLASGFRGGRASPGPSVF